MIPQVERMLKDLGVTQYQGTPWSKDPLEKPYTSFVSASVKPEALPVEKPAVSEEDAVVAYMEGLQKWLEGRTVIIWRHQPTLEYEEVEYALGKKRMVWYVYSRLTAYTAEEFHPLGATK